MNECMFDFPSRKVLGLLWEALRFYAASCREWEAEWTQLWAPRPCTNQSSFSVACFTHWDVEGILAV